MLMRVLVYDIEAVDEIPSKVVNNLRFMHSNEDLRKGYLNKGNSGRCKRKG